MIYRLYACLLNDYTSVEFYAIQYGSAVDKNVLIHSIKPIAVLLITFYIKKEDIKKTKIFVRAVIV